MTEYNSYRARRSNRFLLATYTKVPKPGRQYKGFFEDDNNYRYDESIDITVGLKDKHLAGPWVILDLDDKQIIKSVNQSADYAHLEEHYMKHFGNNINGFLNANPQRKIT